MLDGTLREVRGGWAIDYSYTNSLRPERVTIRWAVLRYQLKGMYGPAPVPAEGLRVTLKTGETLWEAYDHGGYLLLETEREGTVTTEPVPCPKVRPGIETRWASRHGVAGWEKYLKTKGWVLA
jgi:hypothetical protein